MRIGPMPLGKAAMLIGLSPIWASLAGRVLAHAPTHGAFKSLVLIA